MNNIKLYINIVFFLIFVQCTLLAYSGGNGSSDAPYQIANTDDLLQLMDTPTDFVKHFVLVNDIDCSTLIIKNPIGTNKDEPFTGTFNGQNFKLSNIKMFLQSFDNIGLFGYNSGVIKNMGIENCEINGGANTGAFIGYNFGGELKDCYASGIISGTAYVGGLVGVNKAGKISLSHSLCDVTSEGSYIGGICGINDSTGTITLCKAEGDIIGKSEVGGICGRNINSIIGYCISNVIVTATSSLGGICGRNETAYIMNSYSISKVNGDIESETIGGICGRNLGHINDCYWDIETSGINISDGGMGFNTSDMKKQNTYTDWNFELIWKIEENEYPSFREKYKYSGGKGIIQDPWLIANLTDLSYLFLMYDDWNGHFSMNTHIDCSDFETKNSIGLVSKPFTGSFDGNNFEIRNLNIEFDETNYVGLFGYNLGDIMNLGVTNCNIKGNDYVGGLSGYNKVNSIHNCYTTGMVEGANYVGGLVGAAHETSITESYSSCEIFGREYYVGGLCGDNRGEIIDCYSTGLVEGYSTVGGLCGLNYNIIRKSYSTSEVIGVRTTGGFLGSNHSFGNVKDSYSTGYVRGIEDNTGGFCGRNNGKISNCYSHGDIDGNENTGGFIGMNYGSTSFLSNESTTIYNCYSTGNVTGSVNTGGFCGENTGTSIIADSYSIGDVNGFKFVGGFCGYNDNTSAIYHSFSIGKVTGDEDIGGFCGYNYISSGFPPSSVIVNCYWNMETSGIDTSSGAEGLTTVQMQTQDNFVNWSFKYVWTIENDAYPIFKERQYYSGGSGTENDPWKISNSLDLEYLMHYYSDLDAHFVMTNDIDCINLNNTQPIAHYHNSEFSGSFIGNGREIQNLTIDLPEENYVALFGNNGGKVKSVGLNNPNFTGLNDVGGFCGNNKANSTIEQCYTIDGHVNGNIVIGGFCGNNFGRISDCYTTNDVNGLNVVGGFCGRNNMSSSINFCYSTGLVSSSSEDIGGFVATNSWSVDNCYWDIETSGITTSKAGEGKTTAEMYSQNTFINWNFANIWFMPDNGYPLLRPFVFVSVSENPKFEKESLKLYPNPAKSVLNINYEILNYGNADISIYSQTGILIFSQNLGYQKIGQHNTTIDISILSQGVYFINLSINGNNFTKTFTKVE